MLLKCSVCGKPLHGINSEDGICSNKCRKDAFAKVFGELNYLRKLNKAEYVNSKDLRCRITICNEMLKQIGRNLQL